MEGIFIFISFSPKIRQQKFLKTISRHKMSWLSQPFFKKFTHEIITSCTKKTQTQYWKKGVKVFSLQILPSTVMAFHCKVLSGERNIKLFSAAQGFLGWLCLLKVTWWRFSVPESQLKNFCQFRFTTSRNRLSPEDGFRLLVSSNPLLRFRLLVSRDLGNAGKSFSGIWPFSVSHLLVVGQFLNWFSGDLKSHFD